MNTQKKKEIIYEELSVKLSMQQPVHIQFITREKKVYFLTPFKNTV